MRAYWVFASLSLVGCGGRVTDEATSSDASVDSVAIDTALPPRRDSGTKPVPTEIGPEPTGCAQRLDPSFTCTAPDPLAGKAVCTDAMMQVVIDGCFGESATSTSCTSAQKKFPACAGCMINDWIIDGTRLAVAQCMQRIDPKNSCVITVECTYDCLEEVCMDCDYSPGTGSSGGSEMDDCWASEAETQCAKPASEYTACISDPKFSVCYPSSADALLPFFRGACRDNGNWARAYEPDVVDGGVTDVSGG
jgi:hypothetical protein